MVQPPEIPPLVGMAEVADMAKPGTKATAVSNWRQRYPDFPKPYIAFKMGPAFLRTEIRVWLDAHPGLGGGFERVLSDEDRAAVRAAIQGGQTNVSALAERFGCSRGLIYKYAGDLLFEDAQTGDADDADDADDTAAG
jgi:hypothetical protein